MNWLYIVVMLYIVLSALLGFHRGFLKMVYSMAALLIAVLFVGCATPVVSKLVQQYTSIDTQLEQSCEKYVRGKVAQHLEQGELPDTFLLPGVELPDDIQKALVQQTSGAVEKMLAKNGVYRKVAKTLAKLVLGFVSAILSLLVIVLILFWIGRALDLFEKTPGIHLINRVFGFCAGIIRAFIGIWTAFLLIRVSAVLPTSAALIALIEENGVLTQLYEQNRLWELLVCVWGALHQ